MNSPDYWRQRALALEERAHRSAADYWQAAQKEFDKASRRLQDDMAVWYQRFADNNGITLTEAKRLLNTRELEEFRWTVEDYIKAGEGISPKHLDKAVMQQLENASARVHINRLEALQTQLQAEAELLYGNHLDGLERHLSGLYESGYYHTAFELQKGIGVGWSFQKLDTAQIEKALEIPWTADSVTFRDSCWKNKGALVNSLRTQLVQGIIRGDGPDKAAKAIADRFGVEKRKAARLCYTESAHISAQSQKDCYKALGVERFEIVGTLDKTTCSACGALDGKAFPMSQYEIGVTVPPFHPNCHCTTAPYFADMETPQLATGESTALPENLTFEEWLERLLQAGDESGMMEADNEQFFVEDWTDYPDGVKKPEGPFKLLEGAEYETARKQANVINKKLHREKPEWQGLQIHEIHPVKFGGSPTEISNKVALTPEQHRKYSAFWYKLQRKKEEEKNAKRNTEKNGNL